MENSELGVRKYFGVQESGTGLKAKGRRKAAAFLHSEVLPHSQFRTPKSFRTPNSEFRIAIGGASRSALPRRRWNCASANDVVIRNGSGHGSPGIARVGDRRELRDRGR